MSALCQKRTFHHSLDDFVGTGEQGNWNLYPHRLGSFEVYHQLEFCWLLDRKIRRIRAFKNSIYITRRAAEEIHFIRTIGDKPAVRCKISELVDRWQTIMCGEFDNPLAMDHVVAVRQNEKSAVWFAPDLANDVLDVGFAMNGGCN